MTDTFPQTERGCVADQPQRIFVTDMLRLVEDDTAALRWRKRVGHPSRIADFTAPR